MNNNLIGKVFLTMAASNSIFNDFNKNKRIVISKHIATLDNAVMAKEEELIFNTYRYWVPFYIPMQNVIKDGESTTDKGEPVMQAVSGVGVKSLFNNYNAILSDNQFRIDANMPLLDNPESRMEQRKNTSCTIKDLVDASVSGKMGRQVYNYADFAYCKYLGKVSNNYLITLRRFGAPCGDKIDKRYYPRIRKYEDQIQNHMPDIGRMVTWLGTPGNEMSNILKYNFGMKWKDFEAKIEEQNGNEGGPLASVFNMANSNYRKQVMEGRRGTNFAGKDFMGKMIGGGDNFNPPYDSSTWERMYDSNKVYGPLDVIDKIKQRDTGLVFEHKITLTFDYELRSYYGVNGKAAMADLLGNILATTYTHGTFWGGERRLLGASQDNIFANLPIFKLAEEGGLNNPSAVYNAFIASVSEGAKAFSSGTKGESTKDKIINFAKDIGGMLLGGVLNKLGRPQKFAFSSLLSPAPTGCWHLTVGNPMSPILEIGNLCCTGAEIEHYGPLGLDDFPTGLRVKVNLEHGKPRDVVGIEQMYGRGDTRIYQPLGAHVLDMYNNAVKITAPKVPEPLKSRETLALEKARTEMKAALKPEDVVGMEVNKTESRQLANTEMETRDLTSLMRYFGTKERGLIAAAGGEGLYGSEKRKNDHLKNS